ncbi:hypothetical protein DF3PA_330018 [Candidatus Defluviicoccus seviourii]|uniref:Uncharacterized protein n=1 Tax=Candidatus Defluviicoccus seviourii TaxID=2565273 RepID=A0A564WEX0_9PROT|nr:hypothetical protein DF3PA_330018 [Candidatus Defluviicoccus seviourii]
MGRKRRRAMGMPLSAGAAGHLEEPVIASEAKQSIAYNTLKYLDYFVAIAPRNDSVQRVLRGVQPPTICGAWIRSGLKIRDRHSRL